MKTILCYILMTITYTINLAISAGVPQLINFQGRVAVGTTNFEGIGQFKFALVNNDGTVSYWSNDGTSSAGSEPASAVSINVIKGLYSILLGDVTVTNMSAVPASVFSNADVRLRVWFNDGTANGSQLLYPDQRIAAVGYAMMAGNVTDGSVTNDKIADGAIGPTKLAAGAALANLNASGQGGLPSGAMVLSDSENSLITGAGYEKIGTIMATSEFWEERATATLNPRADHTAIWTGTDMIIWGGISQRASGLGSIQYGDGQIYNPTTNTWRVMSNTNRPSARTNHTAVWTGKEMIVWGGIPTSSDTGARYDPVTNAWITISTSGAPTARSGHTAVWSGNEMLVWGGNSNSGGRYNPTTNTWSSITTTGAPTARSEHSAVWTGTEMIVWGGKVSVDYVNDGARYNPSTNTWSALAASGAPSARGRHTAIWTGSEMLVWGGHFSAISFPETSFPPLKTGGMYNAGTNSWRSIPTTGAPEGRVDHTAIWNGTEMIIWGGSGPTSPNIGYAGGGGRFNPIQNTWIELTGIGAPIARRNHSAIWTGKDMIVWSGETASLTYSDETFLHSFNRPLFLYKRP